MDEDGGLGQIVTAPNLITMVRLLCIPLFLWLLFGLGEQTAAALLLAALGATDWVDGYVARRYHQVSTLGKVLDPTADRVLVVTAVIAVIVHGAAPLWFGLATLAREVLVSIIVLLLAALGAARIDVLWVGKAGTFALMASYPGFLLSDGTAPWQGPIRVAAWVLGLVGLTLAWYAAASYVAPGPCGAARGPHRPPERGMKAVIMAGGEGTRLRPQTSNLPKPMLPLVGRPMMEHIVSLLRRHGVTDIVVTVAFLPNAIRSYFGDGSELGVRMVYATEESPLGTAGSVRNARDELTERFLVISGDVLTDIDLTSMMEFHEKNGALATLALCAVENPLEFGIVITREDGSIERFLEKPGWGQVFSDTINTGIYVLEPEIFDVIPDGRAVDFSAEVFPAVLDAGRPLFGYVANGYWEDVGTTAAYLKAHEDILDGKVEVEISGFELQPGVWLGKGSSVDPAARLGGPAFIGENCTIDEGAVIGAYTTIGANARVAERAEVHHSVVGENSYIGPGARVEGTVLGRACDLRRGARCEPGSVVGEGCFIGAHAVLRGGVKVYPYKVVEAGAQVHSSIVWESGGARTLFGREGVQGIVNVDVSPELAVRLAKAWASSFEKGSVITTSRDTSRAARVIKRALMVGCNSVGVNVTDLEVATIPVTRHDIRTRGNQGGLTVRLSPDDPQSVAIRFFDSQGLDLSEGEQRRIERLYHREEFRRVTAGDIGDIDISPRALEHYTADVVEAFDLSAAPRRDLKLVLDLSYGAASFVMPSLLSKVKADVLSINPYAQTPGMISVDPASSAAPGDQIGPRVGRRPGGRHRRRR